MLKQNVHDSIKKLGKDYLTLPWYKKIFFPKKLAEKLKQPRLNLVDIEELCFHYESAWVSRRLFSCLREFATSEIAKSYRLIIKRENPVSYWVWLWEPLDWQARNWFRRLILEEKPTPEIPLIPADISPGNTHSTQTEVTKINNQSSEQLNRDVLLQRELIEKKSKLTDSIQKLLAVIKLEIERLDDICQPYVAYKKQCDHLKSKLSNENFVISNAKILLRTEYETVSVGGPCACGRSMGRPVCVLCHTPIGARTEHRPKPIYVADKDAIQKARARHAVIQTELDELNNSSPQYTTEPTEYITRQALAKHQESLSSLSHRVNSAKDLGLLSALLTSYKVLLEEIKSKFPQSFNVKDYLPNSNYARCHHLGIIFRYSQLPEKAKRGIASFVIGADYEAVVSELSSNSM